MTTSRRGISTIADIRARSKRAQNSTCWIWQGGLSAGRPAIWTLDIDKVEKIRMSGARAVWYIAHGTKLHDRLPYMRCWTRHCVCPAHVTWAATRGELNASMARAGVLSTRDRAPYVAGLARARAKAGIVDTPDHLVIELRRRAGEKPLSHLAAEVGVSISAASKIVRGQSFRRLLPTEQFDSGQRG